MPMFFWRDDCFETLKDVAASARTVPLWSDYADFCIEYERGLRAEAFTILERFITSMERASFEERRRFVSWLSQHADGRKGRHMLIPHPLHVRLVEPTLLEWTLLEPLCSEPHLWLGGYDHVKRAFELAPDDQLARKKLIIAVLSRVDFNGHELPRGYLGNVEKDLAALTEAEELLKGMSNEDDRLSLAADITEQRRWIEEYLKRR